MGILSDNFDCIAHMYMREYITTVDISLIYNTSSSAVSEILRRRGITKVYRDEMLFNRICEANELLEGDDLQLLLANLKTAYPNITIAKIKYICEKNDRHKLKKAFDFINEEDIVNLLTLGKTAAHISSALNVKYSHVMKVANHNNIDLQLVKRFKKQYTIQFLEKELECKTPAQVGEETGFSKDVVIAASRQLGIVFGIPPDVKAKLLNKEWCISAYSDPASSYKSIAESLQTVGPDTVAYYFQKKHNMKKKELIDDYPALLDPQYVASVYNNNSIYGASCEIGCSPWLLKEWLIRHNIPIKKDFQTSVAEKEILGFIRKLLPSEQIVENDRTLISPKEIDILIPARKIAIEYCGIYYHSSKFKSEYYHKNKLDLTLKKGYRLLTIYESEWLQKKELIKEKLTNILNIKNRTTNTIFARKCHIELVNESDCRIFLNKTHIQGFTKCSLRYGLYHEANLVALLCYVNKKKHYELVRYSTAAPVVGGFSKLLKYSLNFISKDIVTFADLRWSSEEGNLYTKTGFVLDKKLKPAFMYVDHHGVHRRESFMKCKLKDKLKVFDPMLTEKQNTENNNIYRIYDCGKLRYVYKVNQKEHRC